jgi:hypothetical protein
VVFEIDDIFILWKISTGYSNLPYTQYFFCIIIRNQISRYILPVKSRPTGD